MSTSMDTYKARDRLMSRFTKGSMGRELLSGATVRVKGPKKRGPLSQADTTFITGTRVGLPPITPA